MPGVPGCIEQSTKLAAALQEAHTNNCVLVGPSKRIWQYSTKSHTLQTATLNAPTKLRNLGTDLHCSFTSPDWTSQPIPLKTGVYQGDPFSGVIINTVICTLADSLKSMQHPGYKFSGSQRTIPLLQFTDDIGLISVGPESYKSLLKAIERWLDWSGIKLSERQQRRRMTQNYTSMTRPYISQATKRSCSWGRQSKYPLPLSPAEIVVSPQTVCLAEESGCCPHITSHQKLLL